MCHPDEKHAANKIVSLFCFHPARRMWRHQIDGFAEKKVLSWQCVCVSGGACVNLFFFFFLPDDAKGKQENVAQVDEKNIPLGPPIWALRFFSLKRDYDDDDDVPVIFSFIPSNFRHCFSAPHFLVDHSEWRKKPKEEEKKKRYKKKCNLKRYHQYSAVQFALFLSFLAYSTYNYDSRAKLIIITIIIIVSFCFNYYFFFVKGSF